uniref:SWIM-type domain-containing protein n=1 Tax=Daphnia galeata TaxID=27404 RepID=A0A8J2S5Z9_9CRUS|nr:unnamed protein product [Daphnia galeata]
MAELNDSLDQVPFKFSAYSLGQTVDQKKSYASKLQRNGVNDCPWGIDEKYFIVGDQDLRQLQRSLPNITKYDPIDYLYVTKSRHDGNRTENLKSMQSYKKFQDGYVLYKALHKLKDGKGIILGKLWVLLDKEGGVITAHCNCPAGFNETCSHIGCVLFCLVAIKKEACTSHRQECGHHTTNHKDLNLADKISDLAVCKQAKSSTQTSHHLIIISSLEPNASTCFVKVSFDTVLYYYCVPNKHRTIIRKVCFLLEIHGAE